MKKKSRKDLEIEELRSRIDKLETALLWNILPKHFVKGKAELYVDEGGNLVFSGKHGTVSVLAIG